MERGLWLKTTTFFFSEILEKLWKIGLLRTSRKLIFFLIFSLVSGTLAQLKSFDSCIGFSACVEYFSTSTWYIIDFYQNLGCWSSSQSQSSQSQQIRLSFWLSLIIVQFPVIISQPWLVLNVSLHKSALLRLVFISVLFFALLLFNNNLPDDVICYIAICVDYTTHYSYCD